MTADTEVQPSMMNNILKIVYDKKFLIVFVVVFVLLYMILNFIKFLGSIPVLIVLSLLISYYYYKMKSQSTQETPYKEDS